MANKYMKLSIEKPEYLNCDSNRNLDFTTAYALLSAPDEVKQNYLYKLAKAAEIEKSLDSAIAEKPIKETNLRTAIRSVQSRLTALRCLTCKSLKSGIIQLSQNVITEENNGLGLTNLNKPYQILAFLV